jgi:hypothetical protein
MNFFTVAIQMFKANTEAGRRLSIDEFKAHTEKKIDRPERALFFRLVGGLSVAWAQVEILLDYSNLLIITAFETKETRLPISLKAKTAFFRKYFQTIPELTPYRDRAAMILDAVTFVTSRLRSSRASLLSSGK